MACPEGCPQTRKYSPDRPLEVYPRLGKEKRPGAVCRVSPKGERSRIWCVGPPSLYRRRFPPWHSASGDDRILGFHPRQSRHPILPASHVRPVARDCQRGRRGVGRGVRGHPRAATRRAHPSRRRESAEAGHQRPGAVPGLLRGPRQSDAQDARQPDLAADRRVRLDRAGIRRGDGGRPAG